jgi:hypothetical protein
MCSFMDFMGVRKNVENRSGSFNVHKLSVKTNGTVNTISRSFKLICTELRATLWSCILHGDGGCKIKSHSPSEEGVGCQ